AAGISFVGAADGGGMTLGVTAGTAVAGIWTETGCVSEGGAVFASVGFCSSVFAGAPTVPTALAAARPDVPELSPAPFPGARIPQKSVVASVNFNSTYPDPLPFCFVFTTWQTTSCFDFSLVMNSNWPGPTAAAKRMTAPLPNTSTVCVVSENGWRLSLPATVLAPFTVTGISMATGCGFAPPGAVVFA